MSDDDMKFCQLKKLFMRVGGGALASTTFIKREATVFIKGNTYTRQEISAEVGGGTQDCLSHAQNRVVAIYLKNDMNPQAPFVMLVGSGRDRERYSEFLCNEQRNEAVPLFTKKTSNAWEFQGHFKVREHSKNPSIIADHERTAGRSDVYMVIHFEEA